MPYALFVELHTYWNDWSSLNTLPKYKTDNAKIDLRTKLSSYRWHTLSSIPNFNLQIYWTRFPFLILMLHYLINHYHFSYHYNCLLCTTLFSDDNRYQTRTNISIIFCLYFSAFQLDADGVWLFELLILLL